MDGEIFKEWLENPATEYFMKYLKDSADDESVILAEAIINGGLVENNEQIRISTVCATLMSISEIDYVEIEVFYEEK